MHFQTTVVERNVVALSNSYVDLANLKPAQQAAAPAAAVKSSTKVSSIYPEWIFV